ncbi:MAG: lamin tail domain-containing protein [Bacteroidales bacterium]|nr:lamin tail domain-containing protein [Bacteroidales bacterium]
MRLLSIVTLFFLTNICYSQVIINEVQSSNASTIVDDAGEYEDWIEIYNPNDFNVDIGGLVLKDNVDVWKIPLSDTKTLLPPHGYFLLWADDEESQGKFHTNFKLSASNGEFLGVFESDSVTVIDSVNIPPLSDDQSYVRCDGGNWEISNEPTPLMINDCLSSLPNSTEINGLLIYPTISKGSIYTDIQNYSNGIISLYLYSIHGKLVFNKQYNNKKFMVDLSHLPNDIYIIKIFTEKNLYNNKILLVK